MLLEGSHYISGAARGNSLSLPGKGSSFLMLQAEYNAPLESGEFQWQSKAYACAKRPNGRHSVPIAASQESLVLLASDCLALCIASLP